MVIKNSSQKFKIIKETILAYIQVVPIYSILSLFENASNNMKMKIIFYSDILLKFIISIECTIFSEPGIFQ
jgi:hypothetical protein